MIDDNKNTIKSLYAICKLLKIEKYKIYDNCIDFMNEIVDIEYETIYLDINMPEMNGYELIYTIIQKKLIKNKIKIIIMSGHDYKDIEPNIVQFKDNDLIEFDYLQKPFTVNDFKSKLKNDL